MSILRPPHRSQSADPNATHQGPGSRLGGKLNHRQRELLLDAVRHPDKTYRIDRHMQVHGVTYQTARTDLGSLVELKLMRCQRIGRAFLYTPVPDLVQRLK